MLFYPQGLLFLVPSSLQHLRCSCHLYCMCHSGFSVRLNSEVSLGARQGVGSPGNFSPRSLAHRDPLYWSSLSLCSVFLLYSLRPDPSRHQTRKEKRKGKMPLKLTSIMGPYLSFDFLPQSICSLLFGVFRWLLFFFFPKVFDYNWEKQAIINLLQLTCPKF